MYYRYAVIDENGIITGTANLSGEVTYINMIPIDGDFDIENKRWNGSSWESYTPPEPPEPQPTQLDRIEEKLSKTQKEIAESAVDAYTLELLESGVL